MEIFKTKEEKAVEAVNESTTILKEIKEKLKSSDKVKVKLDRDDFKEELSFSCGFGFQDLKKKSKLVVVELLKKYDVKFEPLVEGCCGDFAVLLTVKKTKSVE